jgi:hypothetical protein
VYLGASDRIESMLATAGSGQSLNPGGSRLKDLDLPVLTTTPDVDEIDFLVG